MDEWVRTNQLRQVMWPEVGSHSTLQQLWLRTGTAECEWRDVDQVYASQLEQKETQRCSNTGLKKKASASRKTRRTT